MLASAVRSLRVPGGGIGYDYGVYYLTALIDLLGPAKEVFASVKNLSRVRKNVYPKSPEYGQDFIYDNESQVYAVLTLENGVTGTFALNGDSVICEPFRRGDFGYTKRCRGFYKGKYFNGIKTGFPADGKLPGNRAG